MKYLIKQAENDALMDIKESCENAKKAAYEVVDYINWFKKDLNNKEASNAFLKVIREELTDLQHNVDEAFKSLKELETNNSI